MSRVLVTVVGPNGRHHLWLPEDVSLRVLLPAILQVAAADRSVRWRLTPQGGQPLDPDATLADAGVLSGAILLLWPEAGEDAQPASKPAPASPTPSPPGSREGAVELVVRGGPGAGRRARLGPGEHRLGRREGAVVVDEPGLAPADLVVQVSAAGEVTVAPARPGLGITLDGAHLDGPRPVEPGERLALDDSLLSFERPDRPIPASRPLGSMPGLRAPAPPTGAVLPVPLALAVGLTAGALALVGARPPLMAMGVAAAGLGAWLAGGWWRFDRARRRFRRQLAELDRALAATRRARLAQLDAAAPDAAQLMAALAGGGLPAPRRRHRPGWLRLRLGWADQPSGLGVTLGPGGAAHLRAEARLVAARHALLPGAPITLSLPAVAPLGLCGDRRAGLGVARWLALQVVALHRPEEVVVCVALPEAERERWAWLARFPHADPARSPLGGPTLAFGPEEATSLHRRLRRLTQGREAPEPALVAILDADLVSGGWDLAAGPATGVYPVWLAAERLRRQCMATLDLTAEGGRPCLEMAGAGARRLGGADQLGCDPAPWVGPLGEAGPSLLELLGLGEEVERQVLEHWIRDRARGGPQPAQAVLGADPAGRPLEIDLDRDLLILGPEEEARVALECVVASLALRRSPRAMGVLLVGDPGRLGRLPHLVGAVGTVFGAGGELEAAARGRELVVAVERRGGEVLDGLGALARRARGVGAHVVVASPLPDALELALGPEVRRVTVGPRTAGAPAEEVEVRLPAGEEVARLVEAMARVDRQLGRG